MILKFLSFFIQKFYLSLNFNFSVSLGVVLIFRSCSIIINLPCLLNICPLLLKRLNASMTFGFFMSLLELFSLILNDISVFITYWILCMKHSVKQMTLLLRQVTRWKIGKIFLVWVLSSVIFWELVANKVIDCCNMGLIDLWLLFV